MQERLINWELIAQLLERHSVLFAGLFLGIIIGFFFVPYIYNSYYRRKSYFEQQKRWSKWRTNRRNPE